MYDYLLGGGDNYYVDRAACEQLLRIAPSTKELALINRAFLIRAVRYLAENCGVRRFLDFGSGLPTRPNVHEVAQETDPDSSTVYIDNDEIVLGHGRMMLEENANTTVILADMRDTSAIFETPEVRRLTEGNQPVAALFVSVLHCIPDTSGPRRLVQDVARRLPPGSFMVISQLASGDQQLRDDVTRFMHETTGGQWGRVRSFGEVRGFFDGMELLETDEPCEVSLWNPDTQLSPRQATQEWIEYGAVARVPQRLPESWSM